MPLTMETAGPLRPTGLYYRRSDEGPIHEAERIGI
jgi:hypothetical protein